MEDRLNQPATVPGTKLIAGLFFTLLGLVMTLANLELFDADSVLRYWPAVLVVIGLVKLADPTRRLAGVLFTVVGASMLAHHAGWISFTIFDLWPLLLIFGGIAMITRSVGVRSEPSTDDTGHVWAMLTQTKVVNNSQEFKGARVGAFMGGCTLDLTGADIRGTAVIEAFAMWGGVEIFVPEGWEVIGEVVPVMAGFEVRTTAAANPQKRLIVRGTALMAGIEVRKRRVS